MESILTSLETLLDPVIAVVIGLLLGVLITSGTKVLGWVKGTETKVDDKILLAAVEEAYKKGIISGSARNKVADELNPPV